MEIIYYQETDSLSIFFKKGYRGPGYGEDVTDDIVAIYSADDELVGFEIDTDASKHVDVSKLEIGGLPAVLAATAWRRSV